jgi:hypothetical protein
MDYSAASKMFNIENHIKSLEGLDWFDMLNKNSSAISSAEGFSVPRKAQYKRDIEYLQTTYISDLKALGFLLGQGIKPSGISQERLMSFKPLIESLVEKKRLKEGILEIFDENKSAKV